MSRSEILSSPKRPELECALPAYLQRDLDAFKQGLKEGSAWLLKFPPSAAEKPNELSYSNSAYSEHLGSTIYRLLIAYCEFVRTSDDPNFRRSLQKLLPRIQALDVEVLIADTPYLTALQRDFLTVYLNARRRELFGGAR